MILVEKYNQSGYIREMDKTAIGIFEELIAWV
jgi:hypothetical protein